MQYERITAAEIRPGDRVARARSHPFHEARTVRHAGRSSVIELAGGGRVKPRLTAAWWREIPDAPTVQSTSDLAGIAASIAGRKISSVDTPSEHEPGSWLVLELSGGLRLYVDAPTLYGDPDAEPEPSDYGPPPEGLEAAWEAYQHGGHVSEADARKLDEWRADVERDAFGS